MCYACASPLSLDRDMNIRRQPLLPGAVLLFSVCGLIYFIPAFANFSVEKFAPADDGWLVLATESLVRDFDLDLKNQLRSSLPQAVGQTALGRAGQWYPIHEYLIALIAAPFFWTLGYLGCLTVNILLALGIVLDAYFLCALYCAQRTALAAALLVALGSLIAPLSYASFSVDLCSAFFLCSAFVLTLHRRLWTAGLVFGLAVFARTVNAAVLPAFLALLLLDGAAGGPRGMGPWRRVFYFCAAGLPLFALWILANYLMFGGPFTLGYQRMIISGPQGQIALGSHSRLFSFSALPLILENLFDQRSGLVIGFPAVIAAVLFGLPLWFKRDFAGAFGFVLLSAILVLIYSFYSSPFPGIGGNRYLISIVGLSAAPLGLLIDRVLPAERAAEARSNPNAQQR